MDSDSDGDLVKYSTENLVHFNCQSCKRWWSIGDAPVNAAWFCPWCGHHHEGAGVFEPRETLFTSFRGAVEAVIMQAEAWLNIFDLCVTLGMKQVNNHGLLDVREFILELANGKEQAEDSESSSES